MGAAPRVVRRDNRRHSGSLEGTGRTRMGSRCHPWAAGQGSHLRHFASPSWMPRHVLEEKVKFLHDFGTKEATSLKGRLPTPLWSLVSPLEAPVRHPPGLFTPRRKAGASAADPRRAAPGQGC